MAKYLSLLEWKRRSSFSPAVIDEHLARIDSELGEAPGAFARFDAWEGDTAEEIDNGLRRRYAVPLAVLSAGSAPDITRVPLAVKTWMAAMLDERLLSARRDAGVPDPQDSDIMARAQRARDALTAAAQPDNAPHPELPLRSDLPESSGISKGGPYGYTPPSPWGFFDDQQARRDEEGRW
jgi:hypothetical protein